MSSLYSPDPSATLIPPWTTAFRSQRDLSLQIPINFVTVAAVSLQAACFSNNQYEDAAARKCVSNLLASGFRRFIVDLYWDSGRSVWSLCPVQIPESAPPLNEATSVAAVSSTSAETLASAQISARDALSTCEVASPTSSLMNLHFQLFERQASTTARAGSNSTTARVTPSSSLSLLNFTNPTTSFSSPAPSPTVIFTGGEEPLIEIGPYNCTSTIDFAFLAGILSSYLDNTGNTLEAVLTYLILNIHAAAPYSSPTSPAQQPSSTTLPSPENLLSHLLSSNLSSYLYTPSMLEAERGDLNSSWYSVALSNQPASEYYQTEIGAKDTISTPDGWPAETYMEFRRYLRLITSFGTIDPQMAYYNTSGDASAIFPSDYTRVLDNVSINSTGSVTNGCLFDPNATTITPRTNSSWALSLVSNLSNMGPAPNTTIPIPAITNLMACGVSPLLNTSISNSTADANPLPYLSFAHSTLWSWAPGEPKNTSDTLPDSSTHLRCAAMYGGSSAGRWHAVDCASKHRAACRRDAPYAWVVTTNLVDYASADDSCPGNSSFAVPRTALENSYLYAAVVSPLPPSENNDPGDIPIVFLNLNALDLPNCWVAGVNSTCPYRSPAATDETRVVVIPTVAAVIVFLLAALTLFVKCAANRRDLRRGKRRREVSGWDYEGVPS